MKALSIKQPWAWLIIHGGKDVENRTWGTKLRGRFYIHASKKIDYEAMKKYEHILPANQATSFETGGIIGSVELVDCVKESSSPWFEGPVGFVLKDPVQIDFIPCRGRLSFFDPNIQSEKDNV